MLNLCLINNLIFKHNYFQASFDSLHIDSSEGGHSPGKPTHRRYHSGGSFKFLPPADLPESPPRGVVPTRKAEASRYISHHQLSVFLSFFCFFVFLFFFFQQATFYSAITDITYNIK